MTITAVLTTVLTTALVVIVLIVAARLGAASVQQGEAARRPSFLGVALTSWRAEPATVTWSGGTPPGGLNLSDDRCLLYLGQSNGITVLYDATAHRNIRLPSSDVIISVRNEETVCPSRE